MMRVNPQTLQRDLSKPRSMGVDLHSRVLEHKKDKRWWITGIIGLIGVILGYVITALLSIN